VATLDEVLGYRHLRLETATDLARVELAQGDTAQAAARVAAILPDLERGALAGLQEPALAYLTCYQVLHAAGDPRAEAVLAAGYAFLQERAAQFVDEERRSRFLGNLPAHRELLAAWQAHGARDAGAGEIAATAGAAPAHPQGLTPLTQLGREERRAAKAQLVAGMEAGLAWREAATAANISISAATAYRLYSRVRREGTRALDDHRHGHTYKLSPAVRQWLVAYCHAHPSTPSRVLHTALREQHDTHISIAHLNRIRAELGVSYVRPAPG
jgi:transposase